MPVKVTSKGNFAKLDRYLYKARRTIRDVDFDKYGRMGVEALSEATPKDTGLTAASWYYKVTHINTAGQTNLVKLEFMNSNRKDGVPIALVIQYGHAVRGGGWVEGKDYINPAVQPIFEELAKKAWEEIKSL